jgi:hypothetical protein
MSYICCLVCKHHQEICWKDVTTMRKFIKIRSTFTDMVQMSIAQGSVASGFSRIYDLCCKLKHTLHKDLSMLALKQQPFLSL